MQVEQATIPFFKTETTKDIVVDYDQPVVEYLELGKYEETPNYPDVRIPNTYRGVGWVRQSIVLLNIAEPATTDEILREMRRKGLRPVGAHELLAIGADDPELQIGHPIVALGAIWDDRQRGGPYALALEFLFQCRKVSFTWPHYTVLFKWHTHNVFAAVRLAA